MHSCGAVPTPPIGVMMTSAKFRTSASVTTFPLTPEQNEVFRERNDLEIVLNKGHALFNIQLGKEFVIYVRGHDRPPITVSVKRMVKRRGRTVATLERRRDL